MALPTDVFELADSIPRSSFTKVNIAGFFVYLYGIDELTPDQAKDTTVFIHVHGRTRTYKDAEEMAHELLHQQRARGGTKKGLVVATLDNRNHGIRAIDTMSIQDWKGGNPKHAQDMLSMMKGIELDVKTMMDFLEAYFDGIFTPTEYIMTGTSLGGHVTWDVLAEDPRISKAIIIVGSTDLTSMLVERLGGYSSVSEVPTGTPEWPKSIERLYVERDKRLREIKGKKILILNGDIDPLVPSKFTRPWLDQCAASNEVAFVEQEGFGHGVSYQMMDSVADWVLKVLV
ncbi:hypothetical protein MKZ38_008851 [Zalerion maritima]|uniref:Uncharacterized protein n=1 Tax=Zalerion maritima TaxID=339359 RepID=A0AAD5RKI5_9PEZI|nr:hypothetical protein MKZ38_008851 [Zalerion maritima]